MTPTALQSKPSSTSTDPIAHEIAALASGSSQVLTPPFQQCWLRFLDTSALFWYAHRQFPSRGECVAQLGAKSQQGQGFGLLEVGLWRDFQAHATGRHRVVVEIDAGPITNLGGASTSVFTGLEHRARHYGRVYSHRQTILAFTEDMEAGARYRLLVSASVAIAKQPGLNPYGEVIFTCPKITAYPTVDLGKQIPGLVDGDHLEGLVTSPEGPPGDGHAEWIGSSFEPNVH